LRRWWVVLPVILITLWWSHHVYTAVKPVYYSSAVVGLTQPNSRLDQSELGVPVPQNGLLQAGGAPLMANLVVFGLRDPAVVTRVVADGGRSDYTAKMFPVDAGVQQLPLIMIEATEADPTAAAKTVELAAAQADPALKTLQQQAGVPDDQMVKAFSASPASPPAEGTPSRTRATVAVFVAGVALSVLLGILADLLLKRFQPIRRSRRQTIDSPSGQASERRRADKTDDAEGLHRQLTVRENPPSADEVSVEPR
jgi:hypothetical protein